MTHTFRRSRRFSALLCIVCTGGLILGALSCNESLPSYAPPSAVFSGTLRGMTVPTRGDVRLYVYFTVRNTYSETLQDHGRLSGLLQITLDRDPSFQKTVILDSTFFVTPQNLNMHTGIVTVNPGDSLAFVYKWDLYDDNGNYLPNVLTLKTDPQCPTMQRAEPESFTLNCSFQVFDTRGEITVVPVSYVFSYWVGVPC